MSRARLDLSLVLLTAIVATLLATVAPGTAMARDIYIDAALGSDAGAGSPTWPFKSIKRGMEVAYAGDTVHVSAGTYDAITTGETFPIAMKSGVRLQGAGDASTTVRASHTSWVIIAESVDSAAVLDGFTITGGSAAFGAGISVSGGSPRITNNTISGNVGTWGGGVDIEGEPGDRPVLAGNRIIGNTAQWGGGIDSYGASPRISGNVFRSNVATWGGAICLGGKGHAIIDNNVMSGNTATWGGGISSLATCTILNDTIVGNSGYFAGGVDVLGGAPSVTNCIVWGNGDDLRGCGATYSDIEDGDPGVGNIFAPPQVVSQPSGDFRLSYGSACIDAGSPTTFAATDIRGVSRPLDGDGDGTARADIGAYEMERPSTIADSVTVSEDATVVVDAPGVLGNDFPGDALSLTASLVNPPLHGVLVLRGDGSFDYRPERDFYGTDGFTYVAAAGSVASAPTSVTIVVTPVNDSPVSQPDSAAGAEDTVLTIPAPGVLANDHDADGDTMTAIVVTSPEHGVLTLSAAGAWTYGPAPQFFGADRFVYRVSDGTTLSAPATVTIAVAAVDDPPVAGGDSAEGKEDETITVAAPGVLANDVDIEHDSMVATIAARPLHGVVDLSQDGSYTYVPDRGFSGQDAFAYRARAGSAYSNTATVSITIARRTSVTVERWEGSDRYATAARISERTYPGGAPCVLIATGEAFPDALAGAPLAYAAGSPLLLVRQASIPASTSAEIARLHARRAYILGSAAAVSEGVRTQLMSLLQTSSPDAVVRLGGADRYETARIIALEVARLRSSIAVRSAEATWAIIAVGTDFPDSVAAAGLAARMGYPILLTRTSELPEATSRALRELGCVDTIVLGGTAAVDASVYEAAHGAVRLGGATRWETARRIADYATSVFLGRRDVFVTTGWNFPDALAAGPACAQLGAPMLLVAQPLSAPALSPVRGYFDENRRSIRSVRVMGSEVAVPASVVGEITGRLTAQE